MNLLNINDGQQYIPEGFYVVDDGKTSLLGQMVVTVMMAVMVLNIQMRCHKRMQASLDFKL